MPKDKVEKPKKKVVVVEEVVAPVETVQNVEEKVDNVEAVQENEVKPQEVIPTSEEQTASEDNEKPNYLWIIIPTALLVGALVGGLITYFSGLSNLSEATQSPAPQATSQSTVEVTPTASPASSLKREDLTIQVLNGSGVSGAAGKAKTLLEGLGYKTIDTGNASSSNFETTEISIKDSKKEYSDLVKEDLSESYEVTIATKALAETSKYDIVITIGKQTSTR